MMPLRALVPLVLVAACSVTVPGAPVPGPADAAVDASPADASIADDAASTCVPSAGPPLPAACAALPELASPAHAVAGVARSWAVEGLHATRNAAANACPGAPWQDGDDARVRFTAPHGGTWRFTASGAQLWSLDARRDCTAPLACTGYGNVHGPYASTTLTLDVPVQRGESIALTLDGCPAGADCTWTLRAQWIGALSCDVTGDARQVCSGEGESCALDPCDAERFRCHPRVDAAPSLIAVRALREPGATRTWFVGRLRAPDGARATRGATLLGRSNDGAARPFGLTLQVAAAVDGYADFWGLYAQTPGGINPVGDSAVVWLYDGAASEGHPGATVSVEAWSPRGVREICDERRFTERCADGLRCAPEGDRGVCLRPGAVELTTVRAWRDPLRGHVTLELEGIRRDAHVQRYDLRFLDRDGTPLTALDDVVNATVDAAPWGVTFRSTITSTELHTPGVGAMRVEVPRAATHVDVVARDQDGMESAPVRAAITDATLSNLGDPCGPPSTACNAGLVCNAARCEPERAPRLCDLADNAPVWAPPRGGTRYSLDGLAEAVGGVTTCYGGRTPRRVAIEFVAPTTGRYAFRATGMRAFELTRTCAPSTTNAACAVAPDATRTVDTTATLTAGEHARLTVLSDGTLTVTAIPFSLAVEVP